MSGTVELVLATASSGHGIDSSRRFKEDIKPMDQTSEAIFALKPVTFHYKDGDYQQSPDSRNLV